MAEYYFALTDINNAIDRLIHACPTTFYNGLQAARYIFSKDLAADVAPVVRCKDCKHSYEDLCGRVCSYGVSVDCVVPDDFFCADGAKMEETE